MPQAKLPDHEVSYWISSVLEPKYPVLKEDITVDAVIIGAGIAGLSAAYFLKQAGLKVAVLERKTVGTGVTGNTTGKVTSQHNLCYAKLQKNFGQEIARLYGEANQSAIERMEEIITKEKISCDWQREPNYVFTERPEEVAKLKHETEVARKLGLPASFVTETSLPFAVKGAVRFTGQAKFHARKYLLGLARAVQGDGSYIFERTAAKSIKDGNPCIVSARQGTITARDIIVATNVPFPLLTHAYYGAYEYPLKSYVVAGRLKEDFKGMYITPGGPIRSILPIHSDNERLLLIGGESHFPGFGNALARHQRLADYAKERFGVAPIAYRWSTWDYLSNDEVPLIGKLYPWSHHAFVATGFMKWGLTTGTIAGMILADTLLGQQNPWTKVYNASRLSPITSIPKGIAKIMRSL
jgi:glycine/D-amino acid oxidase-like deaminating enzyme